jgi:hypothetical protein
MNIHTEQHYSDLWTAIESDTYDGAEDAGACRTIGQGKTEAEAVADLIEQFEEGRPWQVEAAARHRTAREPQVIQIIRMDDGRWSWDVTFAERGLNQDGYCVTRAQAMACVEATIQNALTADPVS